MNCENIKIMIYEYLDGELPKEKEAFLFTHLSACAECRDEFKQQNLIKTEVQIHQKEVSDKFEKRVFDSLKSSKQTFVQKFVTRQSPVYFNYMLGGVIIIIVLLSFLQIGSLRADLNDFKGKYEAALFEYKFQSNRINAIMNAAASTQPTIYNNSF
jgi:predicted anti-sigma-YlaC factor YlaD